MKKILFSLLIWFIAFVGMTSVFAQTPPSYETNFKSYLTNEDTDTWKWNESVFDLGISKDRTLMDNVRCLFYPNWANIPECKSSSSGWLLWDIIRYLWVACFFLALVIAGGKLIIADTKSSEEVSSSFRSLYYIAAWAIIFFWATWLLWTVISFDTVQWTQGIIESINEWPSSLVFKVLSFLKAFAFFVAIILIVVYWFKIMASLSDMEKMKQNAKGVWYVLWCLVFIKIIDFIYYIAQTQEFVSRASDFILDIAKIVWYIMWVVAVLMVFYAWYLLFIDQWSEEKMKQAKNIIINILLVAIVIFMFLLIVYQLFSELV